MDVITIGPGIRQSFSNFYLKYDCSLGRKIVSLSNSNYYMMLTNMHIYNPMIFHSQRFGSLFGCQHTCQPKPHQVVCISNHIVGNLYHILDF